MSSGDWSVKGLPRVRPAAWATALCFLLGSGLAFSQEFRGVGYKTPAGWEEAVEGDAKIFAPKSLKEGEILAIIITGAIPTNGSSWEKQFQDTIVLANEGAKVSDASEVKKQERADATLLVQTMKVDLAPIGSHSRLYAQVSRGEKRVFVTVLINKDSLLEKHSDEVLNFLANLSLKFVPG